MNAICLFDKNSSYNSARIEGTVKFYQCCDKEPTRIVISLRGFKPNKTHAIHIHEYGDFSQGCMSAGGHYNPYDQFHGSYILHGFKRHAGDLINNIVSDDYGNFFIDYNDELVNLYGPHSVIGRSIVIHEKPDDLGMGGNDESLITGNAGGRMSCAIIGLAKTQGNGQ